MHPFSGIFSIGGGGTVTNANVSGSLVTTESKVIRFMARWKSKLTSFSNDAFASSRVFSGLNL